MKKKERKKLLSIIVTPEYGKNLKCFFLDCQHNYDEYCITREVEVVGENRVLTDSRVARRVVGVAVMMTGCGDQRTNVRTHQGQKETIAGAEEGEVV